MKDGKGKKQSFALPAVEILEEGGGGWGGWGVGTPRDSHQRHHPGDEQALGRCGGLVAGSRLGSWATTACSRLPWQHARAAPCRLDQGLGEESTQFHAIKKIKFQNLKNKESQKKIKAKKNK